MAGEKSGPIFDPMHSNPPGVGDGRRKSGLGGAAYRRDSDAADVLAAFGYEQELERSRSTLSVTFMSFVLASVPYGLSTTLIYPVTGGGPSTVIWGWCLVCALMMCVAVSLGEITSVCCAAFCAGSCTSGASVVIVDCLLSPACANSV